MTDRTDRNPIRPQARAREKAIELDALGCRLPTLLGESSGKGAPCRCCGVSMLRLFHVERGTPCADQLMDEIDKKHGEWRAGRVAQGLRAQEMRAVAEMHAREGAHVCTGCARPIIAESARTASLESRASFGSTHDSTWAPRSA